MLVILGMISSKFVFLQKITNEKNHSSIHLIFGFFCFSQSAQELNSTRINKDIYDRQVSNYV
jgi:hypothetical protein